jgi:beta-phosphoglucomutase-like phosphatase (HAD superfamily)
MTEEEVVTRLKLAARAKQRADKRAESLTAAAAQAFDQEVVAALQGGMKPAKIATATGYSYETIRRIARAHDIAPLREPTVTSRKPKPEVDATDRGAGATPPPAES